MRKKLEEERHTLVQDAMKANPDYKPPGDYKLVFFVAIIAMLIEPLPF